MKRKQLSLDKIKSRYGRMFVLPWVIGFIIFFMIPFIMSINFSLSKINITVDGFKGEFQGFKNFIYIFKEDPLFVKNIQQSISSFLFSLPVIVALSLILAVILNQKFRGRLLARAIFFLPVIIATGVVMQIFNNNISQTQMISVSGSENTYMNSMIDFVAILSKIGLSSNITDIISMYIGQIFNLIWNCGVQIILFIAGLQAIPDQLYEVSRVEGATKWEEFWFITFPMISNIFILVIVYTVVDLFTNADNPVISQAFKLIIKQQNYDTSSAMMWSYFGFVGIVTIIVIGIVESTMIKKWR